MRVLVIDDAAKTRAAAVKTFALQRRHSLHELTRIMSSPEYAPGNDPNYRLELFDGWKVVYTIEQQPAGWFHHISISVDPREADKPLPSLEGAQMILDLFDLGQLKQHSGCWLEDVSSGGKAVSLLFPFIEDGDRLIHRSSSHE